MPASPARALALGVPCLLGLLVACSGTSGGGDTVVDAAAPPSSTPDGAASSVPDGSAAPDGPSGVRPDSGTLPADSASDATTVGCGEYAGDTHFTCSKDGLSRGKCTGGTTPVVEACPRGCLRMPAGQDSVCLGAADSDTFSCNGSYGTSRATDGDYYLTSFGCWVDPGGTVHTDPGDNCIPTCLSKAQQSGLCMPGDTGPQCEERVDWYTADGARFGCLARVRITNPANGKSVIAVALDYGPACSVEQSVSEEVLDASGAVDLYLFGGDRGASDHALVHVVEVDPSTPLGPV